MAENANKYLLDISEAIEHIELFTATTPSFPDYEKDLLVRRAVERELGIIGEAINRLLQLDEKVEIENARRKDTAAALGAAESRNTYQGAKVVISLGDYGI